MITFKKFGKTIKIRNDDWKRLGERFDADGAKWDKSENMYIIQVECPLCDRYLCSECPFYPFSTHMEMMGCEVFFGKLFNPTRFGARNSDVCWGKTSNVVARKQLGRLQKMMAKIEDSQEIIF